MHKICFVTSIIADSYKEADKPPKFKRHEDYDYFLFTNLDPSLFDTTWTVTQLENKYIANCPSNIIKSRYIKFMAWKYLTKVLGKRYDVIIYCDGAFVPQYRFNWEQLAKDAHMYGLVQKKHARCARQECRLLENRPHKDSPERTRGIRRLLNAHAFPKNLLMTENGFFAYDPNNAAVTSAFNSFWDLFVTDITNRDQPLWSYFLWKHGLKPLIYSDARWKDCFSPIMKRSVGFNGHRHAIRPKSNAPKES